MNFVFLIKVFLVHSSIGGEALGGTGIQFDPYALTRPDVSYWNAEDMERMDWLQAPVQIIPRLLVEIASPSDSLGRLFEYAQYYLHAGVQVVWLVKRDPFEIHVFERGKARRLLRPGEVLEAPAVLPAFSEDVAHFVPPAR